MFARALYDGVVYLRRTAVFNEISAAVEGAASNNSTMLDLVVMSNAHVTLKKWRAGSKMNVPLRLNPVCANHCLACCALNVDNAHWIAVSCCSDTNRSMVSADWALVMTAANSAEIHKFVTA